MEMAMARGELGDASGRRPALAGLVAAEMLKWRRSAFPWIALGGVLCVPVIYAVVLLATGTAHVTPDRFLFMTLGFMTALPSGIVAALIAAQVFGTETEADTWKLVLTQPVARTRVFAIKTAIALAAMSGLTLLAGGACMGLVRAVGVPGAIAVGPWLAAYALSGASFLVLMPLYNLVSLAARSYMAPVGVSIAAMIAGMVAAQTKYVAFIPAYVGMALGGRVPWIAAHTMFGHTGIAGNPAIWLLTDAALFLGALVAGWAHAARADFR